MTPWWNIPRFAQPGGRRAFVNREFLLTDLAQRIIGAGNSLRGGSTAVRERIALTGYRGVGKSALMLQALAMLREPSLAVEGAAVKLSPTLPSPSEPERWVIIRVSGKSVGSFQELPNALEKAAFLTLSEASSQAIAQGQAATQMPWLHWLFKRRDAALDQRLREKVGQLAVEIGEVDGRLGYKRSEKETSSRQHDNVADLKATIEGSAKARFNDLGQDAVEGGAKAAAEFIRRYERKEGYESTVEGQSVLSADLVVTALNHFFAACRDARIPTVLAFDDFDEFASAAGADPAGRARVLARVLGAFATLEPTVLLIALREEYVDLDVDRQFMVCHVPPLSRASMRVAVREWALQHEPLPSDATIQRLLRFGDRMFETRIEGLAIGDDDAVVTPFHHLQLLFDAANRYGDALESRALKDVIEDECRLRYSPRVTRLVMKLADALPVELLRAALEHEPVESAQLALGDPDRRELIRHGLITPVSASEQDGALYYLDPLLATAGLARR